MTHLIISDLNFNEQIVEDLEQIKGGANAGAAAGAYEFMGNDFAGAISASDNGTNGEVFGGIFNGVPGTAFGGNVLMN